MTEEIYTIYRYKGWTLTFYCWELQSFVTFGTHEGCGKNSIIYNRYINFKLSCRNCHRRMPNNIYVHLNDVYNLLNNSLCSS